MGVPTSGCSIVMSIALIRFCAHAPNALDNSIKIRTQVFEILATAYTSELVEFHHVREVEAHHSAAIKYVIAHSGYAGRNGNSGELGAIHECMLGEKGGTRQIEKLPIITGDNPFSQRFVSCLASLAIYYL